MTADWFTLGGGALVGVLVTAVGRFAAAPEPRRVMTTALASVCEFLFRSIGATAGADRMRDEADALVDKTREDVRKERAQSDAAVLEVMRARQTLADAARLANAMAEHEGAGGVLAPSIEAAEAHVLELYRQICLMHGGTVHMKIRERVNSGESNPPRLTGHDPADPEAAQP